MSSRTIFLVGAPTFSSLRWDESDLLSESVAPFQDSRICHETPQPFPETRPVKWRLLSTGMVVSETPRIQESEGIAGEPQFFTIHGPPTSIGMQTVAHDDSELSQFYDHSFTVHETSEISAPGDHSGESTLDGGLWTESMNTSIATNEGEVSTVRPVIQGGITNLQDIPSTQYLISIVPQTMTVNLIVAIIAIRPPRRVVTRQWRRELDVVEAVVGDETRTGFGVTFWLPSSDDKAATRGRGHGAEEELRRSLMLLQPRDIVLLRTVGLSCFRDRVYGQSLRKGLTKIELLYRQQVDTTDTGGIYKLRDILNHAAKNDDLPLVKTCKVQEWIRRFVPESAGGGNNQSGRIVTLPPDSQERTL